MLVMSWRVWLYCDWSPRANKLPNGTTCTHIQSSTLTGHQSRSQSCYKCSFSYMGTQSVYLQCLGACSGSVLTGCSHDEISGPTLNPTYTANAHKYARDTCAAYKALQSLGSCCVLLSTAVDTWHTGQATRMISFSAGN